MIFKRGDLFTTELKAIGHGVNCSGVMGAGIAKPIKDKWPNNFKNYEAACRGGFLAPGYTMVVVEDGMSIFNMATQSRPGRFARYDWVFGAALDAAEQAVEMGLDSIAIPMIGCGIGGLKWENVKALLQTVEFIVNDGNVPQDGGRNRGFNWEVWIQ